MVQHSTRHTIVIYQVQCTMALPIFQSLPPSIPRLTTVGTTINKRSTEPPEIQKRRVAKTGMRLASDEI